MTAEPHVRRILHCDMDCFYAAVHMRDDPRLRGKPVVIGGSPERRGVVAAASYEARAFGVRSAMPCARARRLCPEALFIAPDFPRYREESAAVVAIFREFTPVVQVVSIDEAYLDVTDHLAPWGSATAVAVEIRRRVSAERGLTVSVGVGPNRLVAKIASEADKPDGLTVVKPGRVRAFLDPLPVRALPGVGPATEARLEREGWTTIAQLRALAPGELERRFGRHGRRLERFARGEDDRPVRTHRERRSLSSETTFDRDLEDLDRVHAEVGRLAESVARGLGKRDLSARTVTLKVRYDDFTTVTRSQTLPVPTADAGAVCRVARALVARTEAGRRAVRLLGVGGSNLVTGQIEQLDLFG
ncbi:MAG: DNA polymerase IV [Acidobacteriota bacterium]|nr:DNA polymerase IV [Acidobacteriota bacterium]MDH3523803.1 DNA polymerase IV [Acidobacteriota bacterium]